MIGTARQSAIFAVAFAVALLAFFPLGLAVCILDLDEHGITAQQARGSVWAGRFDDVTLGQASLGDVRVQLSPLQLFLGRARLNFTDASGSTIGGLQISGGTTGLRGVSIDLDLAETIPAVPPGAQLRLENLSVDFKAGLCKSANGNVSTDAFSLSGQWLGVQGGVLSGTASCDGERLLLPMTGNLGTGDARLFVRISGDGNYEFDMRIESVDARMTSALGAAGFHDDRGAYILRGSGRL